MTPTKIKTGAKKMGRFSVEFEIVNRADVNLAQRGFLPPEKIRRVKLQGVVDCGATRLVLPQRAVKQLGLEPTGTIQVRYADRRQAVRPTVEDVQVELLGRRGTFTASIEPRRRTALIGAIVLEDLDFLIDPLLMRLVPRDPKTIISEEE
ncbi:MAG TPA: aspartyl protease family protein [Planctomycetaceae bacterium]|nr:aspartyl protease family protein [Planctomycetaceae bacterium]